jgi:huntingtin interacting protein 1
MCWAEFKQLVSDLLALRFQTPPNFLVQSDLRSYVTPVVILPPEDAVHHSDSDNVVDGNLVDTSDTNSLTGDLVDLNHQNGSVYPDVLAERQVIIYLMG